MSDLTAVFIINPLRSLNPKKDSTIAIMEEVLKRDGKVYVCTANKLYIENNTVYAEASLIIIDTTKKPWFKEIETKIIALHDLDMVWMRQDPTVDQDYLYTTYLLDHVIKLGGKVFNSPRGIRNANEKLFSMQFSCIPETLVTTSKNKILSFIEVHTKIIIKTLDSFGGKGVLLLQKGDLNNIVIIDMLTNNGNRQIIAQRYLDEIINGDKRILLINGKAVPYALARIPTAGDLRGNIDAGASVEIRTLTDNDHKICQEIGPVLQKHGLHFVGIDIIGDYCTEINVTSPTCIKEIERLANVNITALLLEQCLS